MERPLVKGRALIDAVDLIRERHGEPALQELIATLDPEAQEILRGSVLANDWYPLDVMTALIAVSLKVHSNGDESVLVDRAERVVEQQLRGIYRMFVRLGSPEFVLKRLSAIHQTYFENVQIATILGHDRSARVRYTGFEPQHRIMEPMIIGFYRKALQISGAKDVAARIATSLSAAKGVLEMEITWS